MGGSTTGQRPHWRGHASEKICSSQLASSDVSTVVQHGRKSSHGARGGGVAGGAEGGAEGGGGGGSAGGAPGGASGGGGPSGEGGDAGGEGYGQRPHVSSQLAIITGRVQLSSDSHSTHSGRRSMHGGIGGLLGGAPGGGEGGGGASGGGGEGG